MGGFGWCQLEAGAADESMALWRIQGEGLFPSPFFCIGVNLPLLLRCSVDVSL